MTDAYRQFSHALGANAHAIEKQIHKDLAAHHVNGEWFSCDCATAIEAARQVIERYKK